MASRRTALQAATARFAEELRATTQQLQDGVAFLSRTTQHKPCVGRREFREALSDLQDEVTGISDEVEVLEKFTVDAISFEELLGHCLALYHANRSTIQLLESHLGQYGFHAPPGMTREPENPLASAALRPSTTAAKEAAGELMDLDDAEDDFEMLHTGAAVSGTGRVPSSMATGAGAATKSVRMRGVHITPAGGTGTRSAAMRKATPASKLAANSLATSGSEGEEDDDGLEEGAGGYLARGTAPTFSMLGARGEALAAAQAAGMAKVATAAASVRASARKAPRPSVDSRASSTPEAMLLSPSMAQLLAKYNPPSGCGSDQDAALELLTAPLNGAAGPTPGSEEIALAMQGLAPFGRRGAADTDKPVDAAAAQQARINAQVVQEQQAAKKPQWQTPPSEDDTCSLYKELIRSKDVPSSLSAPHQLQQQQQRQRQQQQQQLQQQQQQQQQQPLQQQRSIPSAAAPAPAAQRPGAGASAFAAAAHSTAPPASRSPQPNLRASISRLPTAEGQTTPVGTARADANGRSVTPRSIARADWSEHDKILEDKFAGIAREWAESGQAGRTTPLRRSTSTRDGGGGAAGPGGNAAAAAAGGDAASRVAAAMARARSPAPSRAAAEAVAAAEMLVAQGGGGGRGSGAAPSEAVGRAPRAFAVPSLRLNASMEFGSMPRVLSPVQATGAREHPQPHTQQPQASSGTPGRSGIARYNAAANQGRAAQPDPVSTTVVGATVASPRQDARSGREHVGRSGAAGAPAVAADGKAAASKPGPSTPGRPKPACAGGTPTRNQAGVSPPGKRIAWGGGPSASPEGGGTTPARGRAQGAVTPGRAVRVGVAAGAVAGGAAARGTPLRTPCTGGLSGLMDAAGGAEEVVQVKPRGTPGRVARPAAEQAAAAPRVRTPGRVRAAGMWTAGQEGEQKAGGAARGALDRPSSPDGAPGAAAARLSAAPAAGKLGDGSCSGGGGLAAADQAQASRCAGGARGVRGAAAAGEDELSGAVRRSTWGSAVTSDGGSSMDWAGFPLSRAGLGAGAAAGGAGRPASGAAQPRDASSGGAAEGDDVTLAMPPDSPQLSGREWSGTPAALSPAGRGSRVSLFGPAADGCAAAGGAGGRLPDGTALTDMSPGTAALVSKAWGLPAMEAAAAALQQTRPTTGSRIPSMSPQPERRAPAAGPAAAPALPRAPSSPPLASAAVVCLPRNTAAPAAAPPAAPAPACPICTEDDWCSLAPRTQKELTLELLNSHLATIAANSSKTTFGPQQVVEVCGLSVLSARTLLNSLVRLGKLEVVGGSSLAALHYRFKQG